MLFKPQENVHTSQIIEIRPNKPAIVWFGKRPRDHAWHPILRDNGFTELHMKFLQLQNSTGHIEFFKFWSKRLPAKQTFRMKTPEGNRLFLLLLGEGKCVVYF